MAILSSSLLWEMVLLNISISIISMIVSGRSSISRIKFFGSEDEKFIIRRQQEINIFFREQIFRIINQNGSILASVLLNNF